MVDQIMSHKLHNIKVGLDEELEDHIRWRHPDFSSYHILKKSVDARRRHEAHFIYSVEVFGPKETPPQTDFSLPPSRFTGAPPIIIGAGPAGLFAALRFVEQGVPCLLFEQGSQAAQRMKSISRYWRHGELNSRNNVCYGEGGAGLYSDGKLITRIKSPHIPYVMHKLVEFGAPEEIKYLANPHVGSDRIRRVIPKLREYIISKGGQIHYDTKVTELLCESTTNAQKPYQITGIKTEDGSTFNSSHVVLACGHSAEDMFRHLQEKNVFMEGKSFAVGLRVEHPQKLINQIQYRSHAEHPKLGAANYKISQHFKIEQPQKDVGVYSFCMCPGGYVLSSGTDADAIVSNGMSNYNRNSHWANSALVVSIDYASTFGKDTFAGLDFRRSLEKKAYQMVQNQGGTKELPAQRLTDFLAHRPTSSLDKTSSPSGAQPTRLDELFPSELTPYFVQAIEKFERSMKGFISDDATLFGVESRTSCPIRITRCEHLQSISHQGLYPTGEGAGYAGGITSAACDGIRIADQILNT